MKFYEKVVSDTENYSVKEMEVLYSTFEKIVFYHRMLFNKDALLQVCMLTFLEISPTQYFMF